MGLVKQPLALAWESQSLPAEVRIEKKELALKAAPPLADFSAIVPATVRLPLFLQLHVDRDGSGGGFERHSHIRRTPC